MIRKYATGFLFTAAVILLSVLAAHAHANGNDAFGTALGAGAGGIIGNQFGHGSGKVAATLGGVIIGGYAGSELSRSFHRPPPVAYGAPPAFSDYPPPPLNMNYVPNYVAPPAPEPPPSPIYTDSASGNYCREYSETIHRGDRVQESYGTACLQPDGTWRVVQ